MNIELVNKFNEISVDLEQKYGTTYFGKYNDFNIYVDEGQNEIIVNIFKNKVQIYTGWGTLEEMILETKKTITND